MFTLRRLADLAMMALVAIPLFGCGEAVTAEDARSNRQTNAASGAMPRTSADAGEDIGEVEGIAAADGATMNTINRIEGRHFDLYRDYRALAARQMHMAQDAIDDEPDDEAGLRHAVMSFSASSLRRALSGCSMRGLLALD